MKIVRGRQPAGALHLSFDRKVSPTGTWQESRRRWIPTTPNSFGLPSGSTCPGATEFCESCYGAASEQSAGVAELLERNRRLLVMLPRTGDWPTVQVAGLGGGVVGGLLVAAVLLAHHLRATVVGPRAGPAVRAGHGSHLRQRDPGRRRRVTGAHCRL